ncbi:MAG TPA: coenzyme F420-0:L-glutamate ligase [Syntrophomonadaceae bacterium]|nr:coenzyme F420-0:L-glutamate ligase [Syntrophomonadaceae bacterium]
MGRIPDYIGVSAFGIKMGVIVPGSNLIDMVSEALTMCDKDGLLHDGDTVCITESVLARAQNNYIDVDDIAFQLKEKLGLKPDSKVGVVFPILSRNRFALILKGIAKAVPEGSVVVQLSYPSDEVGNQILPYDYAEENDKGYSDVITVEEIGDNRFLHPITKVDYIKLYKSIIQEAGGKATVILSNDPTKIMEYDLDGIVISNVHDRIKTLEKVSELHDNIITLQDICSNDEAEAWSEWGLLGSNMSSGDKLKLAPREAGEFAVRTQALIKEQLDKEVEVLIYGDGAYCDPSTRIYELADPQTAFGLTAGLKDKYREGLKYKYIVDKMLDEGIAVDSIEDSMEAIKDQDFKTNGLETEGTTPRKVEDLIASLADLVSGSADAGTPMILVKGFLR